MAEHRTWGDGATRKKAHLIKDISLSGRWIECTCGQRVFAPEHVVLTLEDVWDLHRERPDIVSDRAVAPEAPGERANDDEVVDFLTSLSSSAVVE